MPGRDADLLRRMIRTHPIRTGLFSAGPILFGLLQFANSYVNGGSLPFALVFCAVMAAFAAMATRYHLVSFRVTYLSENIEALD